MENKTRTWIIVSVVCLIILLPILIDFLSSSKIKEISYTEYIDVVENKENAVIYAGNMSDESYELVVDVLKNVKEKETITDYSSDYKIYTINSNELTDNEISSVGTSNGFVFLIEGETQNVVNATSTSEYLTGLVDAYYNAYFTDSNISYKIAENAKAYEELVESKKVTVAVFGRDTCYYCNIYKPIYNAVAEKYDIDIYYFNSDNYNSKEYQKVLKLGLKIPAECNSSGQESLLSDGFGTPLTIITKKGKTIDCISGYVDRNTLISKLVKNKLIEN